MHDIFKQITEKELEIAQLKKELVELELQAQRIPYPEKTRPATRADIVVGAIVWYRSHVDADEEYPCAGWHEVCDVLFPDSDWKAYVAEDGCRYGLHDAEIEIDS